MKIKNKNLFKKTFSVLLSLFLFNSFILNDFVYGATPLQIPPLPQSNTVVTTNFEPNIAYISDSFTALSNKGTVFFIQDLHTNPSVQKNISNILKQLDKQYGIDYIYMEGLPEGKADISKLNSLKEYNVSDKLINRNIITGAEYYFLNNNTEAQIYGLENWDKYLSNIKRAAQILQDQNYITQTYSAFKEDLYSNISDIKKVKKHINFNLADDKLLNKINQPILKYTELHKYISLSDNINNLNTRKISEEHTLFINCLKNNLPVSTYKEIIDLSKKDNLQEYYSVLYNYLNANKEYQDKYKNLNKLLKYNLQKSQLNIISLISQQNKYFNDYLSSLTNDKFQQDMFVVKMTEIFKDFLTLSISDENYNFFADNYQKYINLLPQYLSQDYKKYSDLLFYDIIFDYHKINKDRNIDFIKNILINLQNKKSNGKATVVIAGGFHSSILEKLKKENISYLLITPNIEDSYNTDFYDEMILSSISNNAVKTNALAPIRSLLTAQNLIPQESVTIFIDSLINALIDKDNVSPKELKNIISSIAAEKIVINNPIKIEITDSSFIVDIAGNQVRYKIEDNNVIWQDISRKYSKQNSRDLKAKTVAKTKRHFNILEATSLQLNSNSRYSSKFISIREGTKRNFMFTLSMICSYFKRNNWAYDLMMGFASLNKSKTTKTTINFDTDFDENIQKIKEFAGFRGKKLDIIVENGLNEYLSREDLLKIVASSISRLDTRPIDFKDGIFIGYLDKSTNLFEDHLNNGFIGVNAGILKLQDEDVKRAMIQTGITHELTHEFKGSLNSSEYDIFEERMMFCDMKDLIEAMAKVEYGKDIDFGNLLYSGEEDDNKKYNHIIQRVSSALTEPVEESGKSKKVPLFTDNVRFIRKFQNYKYNMEDISSFIKRKNFSIRERRGQLKHIENEYLKESDKTQEKLFSLLAVSEEKEDTMKEFLNKHIQKERIAEVDNSLDALITKFRKALYSSDLDPKIRDKKVKEFEKYIYDCLNLMYEKMPDYLFGIYYNEQGVIADHALNHSIEVLANAIPIMKFYIDEMESFDLKTFVYSAFLHDISCTLIRLNHEQNSATFAKAILQGKMSKEEIDKIYECCLGHKKIKNGVLRPEHEKYFEARVLHDADGLAAALALHRILGVWLTSKETFINRNINIDERIRLIEENKYLMIDGGDAVNDLIRQFLRRDRKYYITKEAGDIIEARKDIDELRDFLEDKDFTDDEGKLLFKGRIVREKIKSAGMGVSDKDIDDAIDIIEQVLKVKLPETAQAKRKSAITQDKKFFGIKEKFQLLKQIIKDKTFNRNIVLSDIHGGYTRFAELVINLLDPSFDKEGITDEEINNIIIDRLNNIGDDTMFYLLGDLLDRGNKQVETFNLVKRISETGKMKYVVGNHDLYAFMNLLGLHLPSYKDYKGIPYDYVDCLGTNIKILLEKLQSEDKRFLSTFNLRKEDPLSKIFWAEKLDYYMKYAEQMQDKWTKERNEEGLTEEEKLQNIFKQTFGFKLDSKGKDVLNDPSIAINDKNTSDDLKKMFLDKTFINFHKKFFGRNVGIAVYTGIRGINKMSINWWIDRAKELEQLKQSYPQYTEYWQQMLNIVNDIINQQKEKYEEEVNTNKNIAWAVIDAIMYRNYESTEWNALDWVYHKNWGGGEKGFISQRNAKLEKESGHKINKVTYFEDSLIKDMLNFYHNNFYLYRFDNYGICYMHSLLPVDEDGDVSLGYVDQDGIFHDRDNNGKRIKGFIYKGVHYKGKNIFKGLNKIAEDVRNYKLSSNNLSEISEALTLLTAIYADNTTRVKPANLKEMKAKFGFNKILKQKGITTVVVGHNPVTKLDNQFEYVTMRFFNKEFKVINIVQIDGNMSPEYAPPNGAGLARIINEGINTRGFLSGTSTEITSSVSPDVTKEVFINSIILNIFPILKNILLLTEKIYDKYYLLKQKLAFGSVKINKNNTTVIDFMQSIEDIEDTAEQEHIRGIKNIVVVPDEVIDGTSVITDDNEQTIKENLSIEGVPVVLKTTTQKIKVARGYIPAVSYSYEYDKDNTVIDEQFIQNKIKEYIIDQINKKVFKIKTTKNMFVNDSTNDIFEVVSLPASISNIFGHMLYDTRRKRSVNIVENLTNNMNLDRIKDILSAA